MKNIFLIIIYFAFTVSYGQTNIYHSFPDSSAIWNISAQGCCYSGCSGYPGSPSPNPIIADYNFSYYISGDTIINTALYHKLYKSGKVHEHCLYGNYIDNWSTFNDYVGAYRQDSLIKKVFLMKPFASNECLMYNFNANVGDTISPCNCAATVSSIDSILIGANYRKKFNLSTGGPSYSIIEGVGSTSGLLEPLCPFEYFGTLMCFSQNSQTQYPNTTDNCQLISSINELNKKANEIKIFPNPFTTQTTITNNNLFKNATLTIYNSYGQSVKQIKNIRGNSIVLSRDNLSCGIYFILLTQDNNAQEVIKLIITD